MLAFDNTRTAFADRTDKDLFRAYLLFRLVGNPRLVRFGKAGLGLALTLRLPIKGLIRSTVFKHFCGGENIAECESTIARLSASGVNSLLDYSAEGKETLEEFENATREILAANTKGKHDTRVPFSVFKPTAVIPNSLLAKKNAGQGLNQMEQDQWALAMDRISRIGETAVQNQVPVLIDAEETWFQNAIDELAEELMEKHNREKVMVFNTIQLYRKDRLEYLRKSLDRAKDKGYLLGVKLVRGAYMEKERERAKDQGYPSPIHDTKADTDNAYDMALRFCVDNYPNVRLVAGTHNEKSSELLANLMAERGLANNDGSIHFSQLFGMSDNISFNLASQHYNVVKYVPYRPILEVLPYLIRRAEENTSITGLVGRELSLIINEKERRKAS